MDDEDEMDELEMEILIAAEMWFYSVFWIGIFGIFIWLELPLNILAMLVHPESKPVPMWDEEGNEIDDEENEANLIQETLRWTIQKNADLMHPYAYAVVALFTLGDVSYWDIAIENLNHWEAAIYFACFWWFWPWLIAINMPWAILLSPIYLLLFAIDAGAWILALFIEDGEDLNSEVDEANQPEDIEVDEGYE